MYIMPILIIRHEAGDETPVEDAMRAVNAKSFQKAEKYELVSVISGGNEENCILRVKVNLLER